LAPKELHPKIFESKTLASGISLSKDNYENITSRIPRFLRARHERLRANSHRIAFGLSCLGAHVVSGANFHADCDTGTGDRGRTVSDSGIIGHDLSDAWHERRHR
jgi:hypothetical protein